MLHPNEWDSPHGARRARYSMADLASISAVEGLNRHGDYPGSGSRTRRGVNTRSLELPNSDSEELNHFESSDSDLTEPDFQQALGNFWEHVALEVEEEEKARKNAAEKCACSVHHARSPEARQGSTTLRVNRRRSLSTRHSSALSPYSPSSPTRRLSSPSSVSSRGLGGSSRPFHSLSRPRRAHSISDSCNRRQELSEDLGASPVFPPARRSSANLRQHQSFVSQRSPLARGSCLIHPFPRPQSFASSSFSSTPSPVLRARSLGNPCRSQLSSTNPSPSVQSRTSPVKMRSPEALNHLSRESSTSPRRRHSSGGIHSGVHSPSLPSLPAHEGKSSFVSPRSTPSKRSPQKPKTPQKHSPQQHFSPRKFNVQNLSPPKRTHSPHSGTHSPSFGSPQQGSFSPKPSISPKHSLSPKPSLSPKRTPPSLSPHKLAPHYTRSISHLRTTPTPSPQKSPPKRSPQPSPQKPTHPRSTAPRNRSQTSPIKPSATTTSTTAPRSRSSPIKPLTPAAPRSRSSPTKPLGHQTQPRQYMVVRHEKVPWWRSLVRAKPSSEPHELKVDPSALSVWRRFCRSCKISQ